MSTNYTSQNILHSYSEQYKTTSHSQCPIQPQKASTALFSPNAVYHNACHRYMFVIQTCICAVQHRKFDITESL